MAICDWGDAEEVGLEGPPLFHPHDFPHLLPDVPVKAYVVVFSAPPDNATRLLYTGDTLDGCVAAIKTANPYSYGTQQIIDDLRATDYMLSTIIGVNVETLIQPYGGAPTLMAPRMMELCFSIYDADQVPWNAEATERFLAHYHEERAETQRRLDESLLKLRAEKGA